MSVDIELSLVRRRTSVDEVAALFVEVIEHCEGGLLVAYTYYARPCITEVGSAEAQWRYTDAGFRGENTMIA